MKRPAMQVGARTRQQAAAGVLAKPHFCWKATTLFGNNLVYLHSRTLLASRGAQKLILPRDDPLLRSQPRTKGIQIDVDQLQFWVGSR